MKRSAFLFVFLFFALHGLKAQTLGAVTGWCNLGASQANVGGRSSSNYLQGIVPQCNVTVYLAGTQTLATIYSNATGTPLANPLTATSSGSWVFYASVYSLYDIVLSGGSCPNCYTNPQTISGVSGPAAGAYLPLTGGTLSGALKSAITNPGSVNGGSSNGWGLGAFYAPHWDAIVWNGYQTSAGNYSYHFADRGVLMVDSQPGVNWGQLGAYGQNFHGQFDLYKSQMISYSSTYLLRQWIWQQNSPSDSGEYNLWWGEGGVINHDDEGFFEHDDNGGELASLFTGTVTGSGNTGFTGYYITDTCASGCPTYDANSNTWPGGAQGDGRDMIRTDASGKLGSGHAETYTVASGTTPETFTVDFTVTPSTAWGQLTTNCGPATFSSIGTVGSTVSSTCSVNLNAITAWGNSPAQFQAGDYVCFAQNFEESEKITSVGTPSGGIQSITLPVANPHQSGGVIMANGPCPAFADFIVNRGYEPGNPSGPGGTFKYPINVIGATNSTTLADVFWHYASDETIMSGVFSRSDTTGNLSLSATPTGYVTTLSNTGGTVTMSLTGGPFGWGWTYTSWNGQNLYISGATDSTFNGPCTNFSFQGSTGTCTQSSSTGHTSANANVALNCATSAGCTANQWGNADLIVWKGAQVRDVQNPNSSPANAPDGTYFALAPNPWTWPNGGTIEEPHHPANGYEDHKSSMWVAATQGTQAFGDDFFAVGSGWYVPNKNFTSGGLAAEFNGYQSSAMRRSTNQNPSSMYAYYGGNEWPSPAYVHAGPYSMGFATQVAPIYAGYLLYAGCPDQVGGIGGCDDPNYWYNVIALGGHSGSLYGLRFYPHTNTFLDPSGFNRSGTIWNFAVLEQSCGVGISCNVLDTGYFAYANTWTAAQTFSGTVVGTGNHTFTRHTVVTAPLTPSSVAANTCAAQSASVTGLQAGDHVINRDVAPSFTAGLSLDGIIVTGANAASMNWCNNTASAITPPTGTYTFDVEQ